MSDGTADELTVRDNADAARYEIASEDAFAFLSYRRRRGAIILVHTEVPPSLQGRGLGGVLAKYALDMARADGVRAVIICPFVRAWLKRHPEYATNVTVAPDAATGSSG